MPIIIWPHRVLMPKRIAANPVPFSRSGGRTLGGTKRTTRTDRGFWSVVLEDVVIHTGAQERALNALRVMSAGSSGLWSVPVRSSRTAPYASSHLERTALLPHSDNAPFSDGSLYRQGAISIAMHETAAIGSTIVRLRRIKSADDLAGVRFSVADAAYETGAVLDVSGDVWTVPVFPSVRAPIPAGALMEFDNPTCLCRLVSDRGLDLPQDGPGTTQITVEFEEAVDYWADLAAA